MNVRLDHLVMGTPDVDASVEWYRSLGFEPVHGGRHEGRPTRNAWLHLGAVSIELLGTVREQRAHDGVPAPLAEYVSSPGATPWGCAMSYALATDDLDVLTDRLSTIGVEVAPPVELGRTTPQGTGLRWSLVELGGSRYYNALPFVVEAAHDPANERQAAGASDANVAISGLTIAAQQPSSVVDVLSAAVAHLDVSSGDQEVKASWDGFQIRVVVPSSDGAREGVELIHLRRLPSADDDTITAMYRGLPSEVFQLEAGLDERAV